jgi:putative PIN family toxin of toxin-antitoxin system
MKVVLDTNILLVLVSSRSRYHQIFGAFLDSKYSLCLTTEILLEYGELLSKFLSEDIVGHTFELLENSTNVVLITRYFSFGLIKADPDDNKFVDCAIAANADFIVTNDTHFNVLKSIPFPRVKTITIDEFMAILELKNS